MAVGGPVPAGTKGAPGLPPALRLATRAHPKLPGMAPAQFCSRPLGSQQCQHHRSTVSPGTAPEPGSLGDLRAAAGTGTPLAQGHRWHRLRSGPSALHRATLAAHCVEPSGPGQPQPSPKATSRGSPAATTGLNPIVGGSPVPASPPCAGTEGRCVPPPCASPSSRNLCPAHSGLYLALPRAISPPWQEFITGRDSHTSFLLSSLAFLPSLFPFFSLPAALQPGRRSLPLPVPHAQSTGGCPSPGPLQEPAWGPLRSWSGSPRSWIRWWPGRAR